MESSIHTTYPSNRDEDTTSDEDPDETGESSGEGYDSSDDYDPFEGCEDSSNQPEATSECSRIFMVAEKHFTELFRVCRECLASCQVDIQCEGTVVEVYTQCPSDHRGYWINQDVVHQQPLLNLLVAAGILFAGCNPKASLRILSSIGVQTICCRTFFNLQQTHLFPAIERVWTQDQVALLNEASAHPARLAGDGRADSPGFSAKFGTYSLLDLDSGKIIHFELVQSNEVGGSGRMELAGLKKALIFLDSHGVTVELLVTDRHVQAKAFMRKEMPHIVHEFDVWHVGKGVKKELLAASKTAIYAELALWRRSVENHLYWVAASSEGDPRLIVPKWLSILNHVRDIHVHSNPLYPVCAHGELEPREWLDDDSPTFEKLAAIITKRHLLADLPQLSTRFQTYSLEAFHGLLIHYCPKSCQYSNKGMKARTMLAVLHFNENGNRAQAVTKEGVERFRVKHPKANGGEPVAVPEKEGPTYGYIARLLEAVQEGVQSKALRACVAMTADDPPPLSNSARKVSKVELVQKHKTSTHLGQALEDFAGVAAVSGFHKTEGDSLPQAHIPLRPPPSPAS
ncbi:hypothetical protein HPB47_014873 [Ixodes persulcatus]|uniref:Uncharacterized protein n=1 Tax=Ixodes persulcatus TaxID=34615 RepID=A0AC60QUW7_IXOPE|nr:hypothetical protein HPB47_014873 [Ixodes persulcatus]